MKWILIFFKTKKLVIHLIDDFHVMNMPTKPTDKIRSPKISLLISQELYGRL